MYVDNRSNAAYTVISAMKKSGEGKDQFNFLCNIWNNNNSYLFSCIKLIVMCNFSIFIFISVQDSKSQILNGGNQAVEMQEHKRKIEVILIINWLLHKPLSVLLLQLMLLVRLVADTVLYIYFFICTRIYVFHDS